MPETGQPAAPTGQPVVPTAPDGPVVVLVGAMGAGKTSVARALARKLQLPVRDTDHDVEAAAGRSISDIFVTDGEAAFRALEAAAVAAALAGHRGILALGGGAVLSEETRALLAGHPVVHLRVSMPQGVRRTGLNAARPLLAGVNPRATYKALLEARLPIYRGVAAVEVDTDDRSVDEVADAVLAWLATR
jgi:shikimate kinase